MEQLIITTTGGHVLFDHRFTKINIKAMNQFVSAKMAGQAVNHEGGLMTVPSHDNHGLYFTVFKDAQSQLELHFNLIYSVIANVRTEKTSVFLSELRTLFVGLVFPEGEYADYNFMHVLHNQTEALAKFKQFFLLKAAEFAVGTDTEVEATGPALVSKPAERAKGSSGKKLRNWETGNSDKFIDFSDKPATGNKPTPLKPEMFGSAESFGQKTKDGTFVVRALNEEMSSLLQQGLKTDVPAEAAGFVSGFFQKYVTGGKTITPADMDRMALKFVNHLIAKNITQDTANRLVGKIQERLVGSKTPSFTALSTIFKGALTEELTKILSPTISVDLLTDIKRHLRETPNQPYVLAVVGVNGVGKSTNLSKIAYWLLQNDYRVLITACDTFRSGAVQQLKVHVDNLKQATTHAADEPLRIELFEKGYGDASLVTKVAKASIEYAAKNDFQIVLMDTAGRAHTNDQLMASLLAFGNAANPNKIIMVGEALTGNDSVAQAQNFNKAFGSKRHIDFFLVSKCDTVDKSIGTIVNLVTAIGAPVLFVGVGQTYTDLRTLSVDWAVSLLMED